MWDQTIKKFKCKWWLSFWILMIEKNDYFDMISSIDLTVFPKSFRICIIWSQIRINRWWTSLRKFSSLPYNVSFDSTNSEENDAKFYKKISPFCYLLEYDRVKMFELVLTSDITYSLRAPDEFHLYLRNISFYWPHYINHEQDIKHLHRDYPKIRVDLQVISIQ